MKKITAYLFIILSILFTFSACGSKEKVSAEGTGIVSGKISGSYSKEIELAVVAGIHANSVSIPVNSVSLQNAVFNVCYTHGRVSFIKCDGSPRVFYQTDIPESEVKGLSQNKQNSIADGYKKQLLAKLMEARPEVPELDTLKAIRLAAETLADNKGADRVLVILDSGLSTAGYLDFTRGLLNADTSAIVDALKSARAIPDLTGISVIWMFNGQTASPQAELSEKQKEKLKEIWTAVLKEGGASSIVFRNDISSGVADGAYPAVSAVDVEERAIEVAKTEVPVPVIVSIEEPIETIVLDNTSVSFVGDKAVFVDEKAAKESIGRYAEELKAHPDNKVYVIGTTASGREEFCRQLSKDRAQAVCSLLVSCGVPESQLIPMGLGFSDPWHVPDTDGNGRQIESEACKNRKVLIVDVNSADAERLTQMNY